MLCGESTVSTAWFTINQGPRFVSDDVKHCVQTDASGPPVYEEWQDAGVDPAQKQLVFHLHVGQDQTQHRRTGWASGRRQ